MKKFVTARRLLVGTALALSASPVLAQAAGTPMAPQPDTAGQPATNAPQAPATTQESATAASPAQSSAQASVGNDIVVTAQRRAERLKDVPISVTVQTAATLKQANISDVRELTTVVSGLNYTSQGAYAQPALRGISDDNATVGAESGVAIYLDGVYQPSQQANIFDLADVQNIEVLKGPQGTLFGRNATAGAILIQTLDPSFTPTGHLTMTGGAFETRGVEVGAKGYYSAPLTDNLAFGIAGSSSYDSGYFHDILRHSSGGAISSQVIRGKLLWKPIDRLSILATGYYTHKHDDNVYNVNSVHPLIGSDPVPTKKWDYATSDQGFYRLVTYGGSLKIDYDLDFGTLQSISAIAHSQMNLVADSDASNLQIQTYTYNQPTTTKSQELTFTSHKIGRATLTLGAFAYHSKDQSDPLGIGTSADDPYLDIYAKALTTAYAGFGQATYDITDKLQLLGGIRYSHEIRIFDGDDYITDPLTRRGEAKFNAWTPRASIRYSFVPQANVYFTYSDGFKSGLFDSTAVFTPPPLAAVKPTRVKMYELGVKATLFRTFDINASLFREDITDRQVESNTPTGLPVLNNGADGQVQGIDGDLTWRATHELTIRGNVEWLPEAKYTSFPNASILIYDPLVPSGVAATVNLTGTRFQKAPKWEASALINYAKQVSFGKIDASANLSYSSAFHYDVSDVVIQHKYGKINLDVGWTPNDSKLRLSAFVKNLTNVASLQTYLTPFNYVLAAPREIGFTVDIGF